MNLDGFVRLFEYEHWANRECLRAIASASSDSADSIARMAHILSAERLWLERILGKTQSMAVWPNSTIGECVALADEVGSAWRDYLRSLASLSPTALDERVEYRNSKGEGWSSRVEDILMHVLLHSSYHRGQIALQMRNCGDHPAYTDFIHAVRTGALK